MCLNIYFHSLLRLKIILGYDFSLSLALTIFSYSILKYSVITVLIFLRFYFMCMCVIKNTFRKYGLHGFYFEEFIGFYLL